MMHKPVCKLTVIRFCDLDSVLPFLQRLPAVSFVILSHYFFFDDEGFI
jgi:hypothetical protein